MLWLQLKLLEVIALHLLQWINDYESLILVTGKLCYSPDIESRWPGLIDEMYLRPHLVKVPNGESFKDLQDRAWAGLEEFLNENDEEETL